MNIVFEYRWVGDETCEIYLNRVYVGRMDHGEHGWDGMLGIKSVVNGIARVFGAKVVTTGEEGI